MENIETENNQSGLISRNIFIHGRRTSVRLEPEMWDAVKSISRRERMTMHSLFSLISNRKRVETSMTAAIRVFVLSYYRALAEQTVPQENHLGLRSVI